VRKPYAKTEHAALRGRAQPETPGVKAVAAAKRKNEARQPAGGKPFMLGPNQAKHATEGYGGSITTDAAEDIQANVRQ
jgi:hypothetical protein